jgi:hypothetical protein
VGNLFNVYSGAYYNVLVKATASAVKQYVFTYLSECDQLVVQLIPVEELFIGQ